MILSKIKSIFLIMLPSCLLITGPIKAQIYFYNSSPGDETSFNPTTNPNAQLSTNPNQNFNPYNTLSPASPYVSAVGVNHTVGRANQTLYVCYKYLRPYMMNSYQSRECNTFTGYCAKVGIPHGYWPQVSAQCRLQTEPCDTQNGWLVYGRFDQLGGGGGDTSPKPYAYGQYDFTKSAQAAYSRCISSAVSIVKPPGNQLNLQPGYH